MIQLEQTFTSFKSSKRTEENIPDLFREIAEYFLTKGYLLVNDTRRIYICDVEFYYHEEEGSIKDWIMYHRNNHPNTKGFSTPEYFKLGQLNCHASGIDITFEDEQQHYRAGMLIRGFKIDDSSPKDYDTRSTYFYEVLLNNSSICSKINILWKEEERRVEIAPPTYRKNVPHYVSENVKDIWNFSGDDKYFVISGVKYKQCMRKWRFYLKK